MTQEQKITITGPAGALDARWQAADQSRLGVLMCHPHPLFHGTMDNKVVTTVTRTAAGLGLPTLRFNFRGVGKSQGMFDQGEGELSDAASALDWMQDLNPNAPYVWIAGFNFGAWIGMQLLMRRPEIEGFISVAPPANLYDFSFLAPGSSTEEV